MCLRLVVLYSLQKQFQSMLHAQETFNTKRIGLSEDSM